MEDQHLSDLGKPTPQRGVIPPELEWWLENYDLIRDVAVRRYPIFFTAYDRVVHQPDEEIRAVLSWLGFSGNPAPAVATIELRLRRSAEADDVTTLPASLVDRFHELYVLVKDRAPFDERVIARLNETNALAQEALAQVKANQAG